MRLGIDFGTTRIVVAAVDRGNYPVVSFDTTDGSVREWFPSLIAVRDGHTSYGWNAWAAQEDPAATVVRSIKRYLTGAGPQTRVEIGSHAVPMLELLTGLCGALGDALRQSSSLHVDSGERFEIQLGVPANANGNQRFLTVEAFRRAGFEVLGLLNEPSAAAIEYGHALRSKQAGRPRDTILVYDLGGGTFDASLVELEDNRHVVIASEGIPSLGGDDFDEILADLALEAGGVSGRVRDSLNQAESFRLLDECRARKEALNPNSRRITVELDQVREGWQPVNVPVAAFYEKAQPLIDETVHAVQDLIAERENQIESLYVTGGASELPLVSRALKEAFGRRVRRSSYSQSATAIGLAIQADAQAGYQLRDRFTRNFGVWREAEGGRVIVFDPLFLKGTPLPAAGEPPLTVTRHYYPAHNIGHFRYLECSHVTAEGRPSGEVAFWDEIFFPFHASLRDELDLGAAAVVRYDWGPPHEIEERYQCDAGGSVTVTISNLTAGYERVYRLARWSAPVETVVPGKKKRARKTAAKK
ncbi:MAG: Hsp70 family protein [Bryobacteraceae bacterium]